MAPRLVGPTGHRMTRDSEGHRTYEVDWHVRTDFSFQSPAYIMDNINWPLPPVGYPYNLSLWWPEFTGADLWAFCTPDLNIAPHPDVTEREPFNDWIISQTFSTKQSWRCNLFPIENPLLEPFELSGDFQHEQREMTQDKDGKPLRHPNYQPITGSLVELKYSFPTISISFNSATLPLSTYVLLINKVNDRPLWGLPPRTVRFSDAKWQREVYGTCFYYFKTTYTFEFDINTFDKPVPAYGTLELKPEGDPTKQSDYQVAKDKEDNALDGVMLDARGARALRTEDQYIQKPKVHKEGNLLLLGIPNTLL